MAETHSRAVSPQPPPPAKLCRLCRGRRAAASFGGHATASRRRVGQPVDPRAGPEGVDQPARTLARPDVVRRRSADSDGQQRLRTPPAWPGLGPQELLRLGCPVEWPPGCDAVLDLGHAETLADQSPPLADVVPAKLCGRGRPASDRHPTLPALEPDAGTARASEQPDTS